MNKAHLELIEKNYAVACEQYLKAFCDKYEFQYEKDAWAGGDFGGVAMLGDYFFPMEEMRYMLLNDVAFDVWLANYEYCLDAHELGFDMINLRSWCNGAPRLSAEEIEQRRRERNKEQK